MRARFPEFILARRNGVRWLWLPLAWGLGATLAFGQPAPPLKPPDRSSARAAVQTFLESGDALREFVARDYLPSPSRAKYDRLIALADKSLQGLDLSEVPPAARPKTGYSAANTLYETLSRIQLQPPERIADGDPGKGASADAQRWVIPDTEIALVRAKTGPRSGEFVFSTDTVARAGEFYEHVRDLPYTRPVPLKNLHELVETAGGWMIPYRWIEALPASLRAPIAGQSGWKWIGLAFVLGALALFLAISYRLSRLGDDRRPLLQAWARLAMPVSILLAMPAVEHLALVQLILVDAAANAVELGATGITYLAAAWMAWRITAVVAEAIVASPRFGPKDLDSHLIRAGVRLLGIGAAAVLLTMGADRVGIPLYGIVAGLGVGGLAVALAAQPTVENLIGGLSLFADEPIRVGDYCKYGEQFGTVEAIGIRSARIRGLDRALTSIPNATLAKMPIVNFSRRDRILIESVIGLRYETTPEQLRRVLVRLRELLQGHSRVDPESARVRLAGFGASSLDLELFAYVATTDWIEFLGIREDILLRVMDTIEQAGTALAFPSQTLYLGRDRAPDSAKTAKAAEAYGRD